VGSYIFLESEKPKYPTGFGSSLAFAVSGIVAALTVEYLYWRHNKKYEKMTEEEANDMYGSAVLEKMGDRSPLFRYSL